MKKLVWAATLTILSVLAFGQPSAMAEARNDPSSDLDNYKTAAPGFFAQTDAKRVLGYETNGKNQDLSVRDASAKGRGGEVKIHVLGAKSGAATANGIQLLQDTEPGHSQLVQPLDSGFRIVNVMHSKDASNAFAFALEIPKDAHLEMVEGSVQVLVGDVPIGSLKAPWAFDANGIAVPTRFEINGNFVTQIVEVNSATTFPVVSDPNWGYVFTYTLRVSPTVAWAKLGQCFNCYFPVNGAPHNFPVYNQLLPLTVQNPVLFWVTYNMECRMNTVTVGTGQYSWKFVATQNHIDGQGSTIIFQLKNVSGLPSLVVDASIVNNNPGNTLNSVYQVAAQNNWATFAANLGN